MSKPNPTSHIRVPSKIHMFLYQINHNPIKSELGIIELLNNLPLLLNVQFLHLILPQSLEVRLQCKIHQANIEIILYTNHPTLHPVRFFLDHPHQLTILIFNQITLIQRVVQNMRMMNYMNLLGGSSADYECEVNFDAE